MAIQNLIASLRNFDASQLNDLDSVGSWPVAVKAAIQVICFLGVLVLGYALHITSLQRQLASVQAEETRLLEDYEKKFFEAAHLEAYRRQQKGMEASFDAILRQLPSDTEIPGLIEDITLIGLKNGLSFASIDLQPESAREFYIEKPIAIVVSGGYHGLGSFVSDVAALSRIVTLHDFAIRPTDSSRGGVAPGNNLTMTILAKTYRYKGERDG